jgi:hypothetical protein
LNKGDIGKNVLGNLKKKGVTDPFRTICKNRIKTICSLKIAASITDNRAINLWNQILF